MRQRGAMDPTIGLEAVRAMAEPPGVDAAVELLALVPLQVIGFGFTSSSYVIGRRGEVEMCARLSELAGGLPIVAAGAAMCDAAERLEAERVFVVSPPWFDAQLAELGSKYLDRCRADGCWRRDRRFTERSTRHRARATPLLVDGKHPGRRRRTHHRGQWLPSCRRHRTPRTRPRTPRSHREPGAAVGMPDDERVLGTGRRIRTTLRLTPRSQERPGQQAGAARSCTSEPRRYAGGRR